MTRALLGILALLLSSREPGWGEYSVTVSWDPPLTYVDGTPALPEDIGGYVLQYGTVSQHYSSMLDVGPVTTAPLTGLVDGTPYYLVVTAYDTLGISSGFSVPELTISPPGVPADTSPPTVLLTAPADQTTVPRHAAIVLTATATDASGVVSVVFVVNGSVVCTATVQPYRCTWNVPAPPRRTYTLQAKAYDPSANLGQSPLVTVESR